MRTRLSNIVAPLPSCFSNAMEAFDASEACESVTDIDAASALAVSKAARASLQISSRLSTPHNSSQKRSPACDVITGIPTKSVAPAAERPRALADSSVVMFRSSFCLLSACVPPLPPVRAPLACTLRSHLRIRNGPCHERTRETDSSSTASGCYHLHKPACQRQASVVTQSPPLLRI